MKATSENLPQVINGHLAKYKDVLDRIAEELEEEVKAKFPDANLDISRHDWPKLVTLYSGPRPVDIGKVDPQMRKIDLAIELFTIQYRIS